MRVSTLLVALLCLTPAVVAAQDAATLRREIEQLQQQLMRDRFGYNNKFHAHGSSRMSSRTSLPLLPTAAESPAVLVRSVPAQRATLEAPPVRVELWFNERLEPAYSRVSVLDEANAQVDLRDAAVATDAPRRLSVSLPALGPGRYRVEFRVLSVDGHVIESKLRFTVKSSSRRTP